MIRLYFLTFVFYLVGISTSCAQDAPIVVTEVKITFFVPVRTQDKDEKTEVSATLYTAMGKRVASLERCCGDIHYPDANFTSNTYQLSMRNTVSKAEMQTGYFDIHIDPVTNEKWMLIPTLQISFSDGTKAIIKGPEPGSLYIKRLVCQEAPDTTFPFHL